MEVFNSPLHADGVCCKSAVQKESVLFTEVPFLRMQSIQNRQLCLCCAHCLRFIGNDALQSQFLIKMLSRQQIQEQISQRSVFESTNDIILCSNQCGEFYCSQNCRDSHWAFCHQLLCTGCIADEEAMTHPLIGLKIHALENNEIFLLVADLFAHICIVFEENEAKGNELIGTLNKYVRHRWEDCVVVPKRQKKSHFQSTLKRLVAESYAFLHQALALSSRQLDALLDEDFLSRTIGMFEQNNVGIRLPSPLSKKIESLRPDSPDLDAYLHLIEQIALSLEGF